MSDVTSFINDQTQRLGWNFQRRRERIWQEIVHLKYRDFAERMTKNPIYVGGDLCQKYQDIAGLVRISRLPQMQQGQRQIKDIISFVHQPVAKHWFYKPLMPFFKCRVYIVVNRIAIWEEIENWLNEQGAFWTDHLRFFSKKQQQTPTNTHIVSWCWQKKDKENTVQFQLIFGDHITFWSNEAFKDILAKSDETITELNEIQNNLLTLSRLPRSTQHSANTQHQMKRLTDIAAKLSGKTIT